MIEYKKYNVIFGWIIFAIASWVYLSTMEPTASFWDCGEFILGAHKLQVVHPPGAPLFLLIARIFASIADAISSNPADIAFAVNLLSGLCSAGLATVVCLISMMIGKEIVSTDNENLSSGNPLYNSFEIAEYRIDNGGLPS